MVRVLQVSSKTQEETAAKKVGRADLGRKWREGRRKAEGRQSLRCVNDKD